MWTEDWLAPIREFDRMRRLRGDLRVAPPLAPAADVYETNGELIVELDVPGFDETQLEVEVFEHTLIVKGRRETKTRKQAQKLRLRERLEGEFERRFSLSWDVDSERIKAECANGVLTLHVPKLEVVSRARSRSPRHNGRGGGASGRRSEGGQP
jgi:HSP20 family protein